MSRNSKLVLFAVLSLFGPTAAFAQLVPPAGSAGAGNSAISGIPFGPANPSVLSDPSGIGKLPPGIAQPLLQGLDIWIEDLRLVHAAASQNVIAP